jgi:hypothetical protein
VGLVHDLASEISLSLSSETGLADASFSSLPYISLESVVNPYLSLLQTGEIIK